ncbi:MAG: hypothetical protein J6T76_00785 [Paludibacteraceae bacterium]|nr:hypothetical protein [Paludibacteraceae bacterium]
MIDAKAIGSPRAWDLHQKIIVKTIFNMMPEVEEHRGWDILPEALVTENPNDNYPDIIIKDEHKRLVFSMEITRKKYIHYDIRKCEQLQLRFPNAEFYIYNYETDVLYTLGEDRQWYSSNEYSINSRLFARPLIEYIYVPEEY